MADGASKVECVAELLRERGGERERRRGGERGGGRVL